MQAARSADGSSMARQEVLLYGRLEDHVPHRHYQNKQNHSVANQRLSASS
jgi:hypothetical protein